MHAISLNGQTLYEDLGIGHGGHGLLCNSGLSSAEKFKKIFLEITEIARQKLEGLLGNILDDSSNATEEEFFKMLLEDNASKGDINTLQRLAALAIDKDYYERCV